MRSGAAVGLLFLAVATAALGSCGSGEGSTRERAAQPAPRAAVRSPAGSSHVFVIVLENREFGQVIGNDRAPYINRLARRGALAVRYFGVTHPSLPNYLAIIGGSTFGIDSDCTDCTASDPNLALQLDDAGISWRGYMEAMPAPCFQGAFAGRYAKKHNPFLYFPSIRDDPERCANVVPGGRLDRDLERKTLPAFAWITPDQCQDAHDCSIGRSDRYLSRLVPKLRRNLGPQGFLVLTFDEGTTNAGCCDGSRGGRIVTILTGPPVRDRARVRKSYDHYSLLRTLEDAFSLPHIRNAADARSMRAAFSRFPVLR